MFYMFEHYSSFWSIVDAWLSRLCAGNIIVSSAEVASDVLGSVVFHVCNMSTEMDPGGCLEVHRRVLGVRLTIGRLLIRGIICLV